MDDIPEKLPLASTNRTCSASISPFVYVTTPLDCETDVTACEEGVDVDEAAVQEAVKCSPFPSALRASPEGIFTLMFCSVESIVSGVTDIPLPAFIPIAAELVASILAFKFSRTV